MNENNLVLGNISFYPYNNNTIYDLNNRKDNTLKKFSHLMVDLETLGTQSNSVVLSIGAVCFDIKTGELGSSIELFPTVDDQFKTRKVQWDSVCWWMKQCDSAKNKIIDVNRTMDLKNCLGEFSTYCNINLESNFKIWGNGFDIPLLNQAYNDFEMKTPWSYKNIFDCRTITWLSKISTNKYSNDDDVKHSAVSDCKFQIRFVTDAYKILKDY